MFRRRIGGVVVVVVVVGRRPWRACSKKTLFTQEKNFAPDSDCNGRILGKRKPFRVKRKVFLNEKRAPDAMEQSFQPRNVQKCQKMEMRQLASRSRSTTGAGLQTGSDTMFDNTGIPTEDEHLQ
jgi:hypothetical protein